MVRPVDEPHGTGRSSGELSESMLTALVSDERVVTAGERQLLQSISRQVAADHGPAAAGSIIAATGRVISERLVQQLGRAVAERIVGVSPDPLIPGHPVDPPPDGPPPVFPDPAPPNPPNPPIPAPPDPFPGPHPSGPVGPWPLPPAPIPPPWPMPPFSIPGLTPEEWQPTPFGPEEPGLDIDDPLGQQSVAVQFMVVDNFLTGGDLADVHAWLVGNRDRFIEETTVRAGEDASARTVRVCDDIGDLASRIAARIQRSLPGAGSTEQPTGSVDFRIVEVAPGEPFDLGPPPSGTGAGVIALVSDAGREVRIQLRAARRTDDVATVTREPVSVAAGPNVAVLFPAQLTAVAEVRSVTHESGNTSVEEPSGPEAVWLITGHLGS